MSYFVREEPLEAILIGASVVMVAGVGLVLYRLWMRRQAIDESGHAFAGRHTVQKNRLPPTGRNGHSAVPHPAPESARAPDEAVDFDNPVDFEAGQHEQEPTPEIDPFQLLLRQFRELGEYFWYYLSAKADSAKLGLRNAVFSMTLAALAFVVVASLSVTATWLVLTGTSEGLGLLFGNQPWAGSLVTGLLVVAGLAGGIYGIMIKLKKSVREGTVSKYETQQSRQQDRYGHNVADRAAANGPEANGPEE